MNIAPINNSNKPNFKARINAPRLFWYGLSARVLKNCDQDELYKVARCLHKITEWPYTDIITVKRIGFKKMQVDYSYILGNIKHTFQCKYINTNAGGLGRQILFNIADSMHNSQTDITLNDVKGLVDAVKVKKGKGGLLGIF